MSAEDVPAADQADVGEALVAALGFEPTDGRKVGKKANSSAADASAEANGSDVAGDASTNGKTDAAAAADETLSVVSPENQQAPDSTSGSDGSTGANKSGQNKSTSAKKRNRNRNRNNRSSGSGSGSKSGSNSKAASGSKNNAQSKAETGGSDNPEAKAAAAASESGSGNDIKSAAKPTVSGGSTSADQSATAGSASGLSDSAINTTVEMAMPASPSEAAAITGEIQVVPESASPPPPPSGSDAIKIDADTTVRTAAPSEPPTAPPVKPSTPEGEDKVARAERMAAAAKAKVQVDTPAEIAPVVENPAAPQPPAPGIEVATPAAPVVPASTRSLGSLTRDGSLDLAQVRNLLRRKRRVQARKVRRVVRHVDPWSVLTFSVLFHLCVFAALLLASVLVWNAAESAGTIENLETFILELGDYETFEIRGDVVFRAAVAIAGVLTLASSVLLVLLTVVFNLISDLVGGIRMTVIEEETVRVRRRKKTV